MEYTSRAGEREKRERKMLQKCIKEINCIWMLEWNLINQNQAMPLNIPNNHMKVFSYV